MVEEDKRYAQPFNLSSQKVCDAFLVLRNAMRGVIETANVSIDWINVDRAI